MLSLRSVNVDVQDLVTLEWRSVLYDLSVTFHPGEAVAIVGPNGAGKSTLLLATAGALPLKSGTIVIGDMEVAFDSKSRRRLREKLGLALQFPERGFFARSVREEVGFTCARLGWASQLQEQAVAEALVRVGLSSDFLERPLFELSGGEKRLVALAAALAHRPQVLLLDEPEVGLDHRGVRQIGMILRDFAQDGRTALVVTHDLESALAWANRLLLLKDGRLVADLDVKQLTSMQSWQLLAPWLWDRSVFGMAYTKLFRNNPEVPSPYGQATEFYKAIKKLLERRAQ